jgi:hypothetical protein
VQVTSCGGGQVFTSWPGFREAYRIEKWREAALILREEDPARYERIIANAPPEIAEAVEKDSDAFVALFLASANDAGVLSVSHAHPGGASATSSKAPPDTPPTFPPKRV